ncbi:ribosomal protein S18 acetylase RimI-like enzyme [Variovorax sp. 54]|uniref:GNAT family N-acetyltransferase n=1 Tax=Variovorax sp. 54 TaxID=2035212 RepID=UPI000C384247|nr:GNAT family N-acetyltransferase [Variovorax sp. 54]PIF73519.1 ribosomal protein S18 acetylase RimI-like enzyme [Variovorax sp. 54]
MNFDIVPAANFGTDELTALWNRAYEDYFVPIAFDRAMFERHVRRAEADLALSRVIVVDGDACGLSLVGRRGPRAYLAGFGIASAQRRRGLAKQLIEAQLRDLAAAGIAQVQLEVIEQNPARQLYRQAGFVEVRTLEVLEGSFEPRADATSTAPDTDTLAAVHAACTALSSPTWRREWPTVQGALAHDGAVALGTATGGYAILLPTTLPLNTLLDAAALDEASAHALLNALAQARPGARWRLVDEPEGSPMHRALTARGATLVIRQIEMTATLQPTSSFSDSSRPARS